MLWLRQRPISPVIKSLAILYLEPLIPGPSGDHLALMSAAISSHKTRMQTLRVNISTLLTTKQFLHQSIDLAMRDSRKFETSLAIWALAPASPLARESHQTGSRLWYRLGLSSVTIPIIKQMSSFIWIVLSLFSELVEFSWVKLASFS